MLTLIEHEDYYKHKMSQIKENPRRLRIIMKAITTSGILDNPSVKLVSPESATDKDVRVLHTDQLVDLVKHGSMVGETAITGDTITNEYTFQAALRGVGGAFLAAETANSKNDSAVYHYECGTKLTSEEIALLPGFLPVRKEVTNQGVEKTVKPRNYGFRGIMKLNAYGVELVRS